MESMTLSVHYQETWAISVTCGVSISHPTISVKTQAHSQTFSLYVISRTIEILNLRNNMLRGELTDWLTMLKRIVILDLT